MDYNYKYGEELGKVISIEDKKNIESNINPNPNKNELEKIFKRYTIEVPKDIVEDRSKLLSMLLGMQKSFLNKE